MATIVFSHGFGVKADACGMFTQIADTFPQDSFVFFDYNKILENGDIEVAPLNVQAQILQEKLNQQNEEVVLIAHSQGSIVTGMVELKNVRKVVLLAPPVVMSMRRVVDKLMNKPNAVIDLDGVSKLPRSDGTTTHISKEYIASIDGVNPLELYQSIANTVATVIVRCTEDEVLGLTNVNKVHGAKHIDVKSDHDFSGSARQELLAIIRQEL